MTRSVQVVRLLAAVVIALASCSFVVSYDKLAYIRYPFDHPNADGHYEPPGQTLGGFVLESRPSGAEFVTAHRTHAYVVPLIGLLLGIPIIWRWPKLPVLVELVVASLWIFAFLWAGLVLIVWQMQNIPIFHGMRWHY
jgi:hypothetical protein